MTEVGPSGRTGFVVDDYWPVVVTYDRGAWGFGIDHGSMATKLFSSWECAPLDPLEGVVDELVRRVRLTIPDKYLRSRVSRGPTM